MENGDGSRTSTTLVGRLQSLADADAWTRFWHEFEPRIRRWARRMKLQPADEDDILGEVMLKLVQKMPDFEYDPTKGGYRGWLYRVVYHSILDYREKQSRAGAVGGTTNVQVVSNQADPMTDSLVSDLCEELDLLHAAEELVRREIDAQDFAIYVRTLYENQKSAAVAQELGLPVKDVYNTSYRVRLRIRTTADRLREQAASTSRSPPERQT